MDKKWRIGDVAKAFNIFADTLRYYEKAGQFSARRLTATSSIIMRYGFL